MGIYKRGRMATTMEINIRVPDACEDCGDTKNGSHTCDATPHRNTPQLWRCWGCKDGNHVDVECAFEISLHRRINFGECLCCTSKDFASESVMCKECDAHARRHPEVINYDGCCSCERVGIFSNTCRFCQAEAPNDLDGEDGDNEQQDDMGCPGCGEPGWNNEFCSRECMRERYDSE